MEEDDDDPIAALEARLDAVRARARASIPERVTALEEALVAHRRGAPDARDSVRRIAHQLRGIAEEHALRDAAEAVELAATRDDATLEVVVRTLIALVRGAAPSGVAERAPARPPSGPRFAPSPSGPSLRVLVVDDTESLRKLSRLALERMGGHSVVEASSPREALVAAEASSFDVVLLDAMMPGGSGVDLAVQMRARLPGAKLVILSAASEAQLAPDGHVADAWWQKPLPPAALVQRIAELVSST